MKVLCSDLKSKDVINIETASVVGRITDVEFDTSTGQITSLMLSRDGGVFSLFREPVMKIAWSLVECIGEDIVLVRMKSGEVTSKHNVTEIK